MPRKKNTTFTPFLLALLSILALLIFTNPPSINHPSSTLPPTANVIRSPDCVDIQQTINVRDNDELCIGDGIITRVTDGRCPLGVRKIRTDKDQRQLCIYAKLLAEEEKDSLPECHITCARKGAIRKYNHRDTITTKPQKDSCVVILIRKCATL